MQPQQQKVVLLDGMLSQKRENGQVLVQLHAWRGSTSASYRFSTGGGSRLNNYSYSVIMGDFFLPLCRWHLTHPSLFLPQILMFLLQSLPVLQNESSLLTINPSKNELLFIPDESGSCDPSWQFSNRTFCNCMQPWGNLGQSNLLYGYIAYNIRRICLVLSTQTSEVLAQSLVISRLDNLFLAGLPFNFQLAAAQHQQ